MQAAAADSAKGVEVLVNVKYEPFTIGETRAILKLTSPEGMEYTCLLLGKTTAPLPQVIFNSLTKFRDPLNAHLELNQQQSTLKTHLTKNASSQSLSITLTSLWPQSFQDPSM